MAVMHTPGFHAELQRTSKGAHLYLRSPRLVVDHGVASLLQPIPDVARYREEWLEGPWIVDDSVSIDGETGLSRSYGGDARYRLRVDADSLLPVVCSLENAASKIVSFFHFELIAPSSSQVWLREVLTLIVSANMIQVRQSVIKSADFTLTRRDFVIELPKRTSVFDYRTGSLVHHKRFAEIGELEGLGKFFRFKQ